MSQTSREQTLRLLDDREPAVRLAAVRRLAEREAEARPAASRDVNNHIHTVYSFSPYTPSRAVWEALDAGLATAGIMDHDTVAGAAEFREAGRLLGLPVTVGAELRVSFAGTPIAGRRINNPDQEGVAYLAFHGVPASQIDAVDRFFRPVRAARGVRNRVMALRLDRLAREAGTSLDYDRDVLPLSEAARGGSVTERHLLYALAAQLMRSRPDRSSWSGLLRTLWGLNPGEKAVRRITDPGNPHVLYDLLGIFKSELLPSVYEPATDELVPVRTALEFAASHGIIAAYPYLGDVGESVTGDKKAQRFEDAYLDELFVLLADLGVRAVTYMPSRNTTAQLDRLRSLCVRYGMFEISGEDINQPSQPFVCEAMRQPGFEGLYDAAWALIGHEQCAAADPEDGLFADKNMKRMPVLADRVRHFSALAKAQSSRTSGGSNP